MTEDIEQVVSEIAARQEALMHVICALIQSHPNPEEWRDAMMLNLFIKSNPLTPKSVEPERVTKYLEWFKALPI